MAKRGLGRGLGALIPGLSSSEETIVRSVPVADVRPNSRQPRTHFDQETFDELVGSVKAHGLLQPVLVRPRGAGFELIAGERRWRAAREAGLKSIPAIVREVEDVKALEMAVIENLQRDNLNPIDEAMAFQHLMEDFGLSQEEVGARVGRSRAAVANSLRLLRLSPDIRRLVREGAMSQGHARALLAVDEGTKRDKIAERLLSEQLSVRETEKLAKLASLPGSASKRKEPSVETSDEEGFREHLSRTLSAKVRIAGTGPRRRIEIEFHGQNELERLVGLITGKTRADRR